MVASAALKSCPTPRSFTVGPFFADQLRARGVSCRKARTVAKRWGNCRFSGRNDRVCRVRGRYVCRYRDIRGFEGGRTTCKAGTSRAVGFRWGS